MSAAAAASSSRPRTSDAGSGSRRGGRGTPRWRLPGLRVQPVPHCRLPGADQVLAKYEVGDQLGRGNFGTVYRATERSNGDVWAVKVVPKSGNKLKMLLLSREIQVLKLVQHPNVVYLREIFETPENVYLILELCERGELATFSRQRGKLSETDAKSIMSGVASAIHYLHRHGIVHRDLKLENILLATPPSDESTTGGATPAPRAKLSDFGLAEVKDKRDHDHMMDLFCGTPYCMAPEILSERAYSQQCDVWSMGVILYNLVTGSSPYTGGSERDVLYSIYRHPNLQDDPALDTVTPALRDLLTRMLHLDPAYRITAAEVVGHPWLAGDGTQASASQDILTLMKEWRMEMTASDDVSSAVGGSADAVVTQWTVAGVPARLGSPRATVSSPAATSPRTPKLGRGSSHQAVSRRAMLPSVAVRRGAATPDQTSSPPAPEMRRNPSSIRVASGTGTQRSPTVGSIRSRARTLAAASSTLSIRAASDKARLPPPATASRPAPTPTLSPIRRNTPPQTANSVSARGGNATAARAPHTLPVHTKTKQRYPPTSAAKGVTSGTTTRENGSEKS